MKKGLRMEAFVFYGNLVDAGMPSYIGISNTRGWFRMLYIVYEAFVDAASLYGAMMLVMY